LQDVRHLFEQYTVFPFDLRVPLFEHLVLFRFGFEVVELGGLLHFNSRLDVLQFCQMYLVLFLLPLGRQKLACFGLRSVHLSKKVFSFFL